MQSWQIDMAQARLSDVIDSAGCDGPQEIKERDKSVAFVVSREWFDQRISLIEDHELLHIVRQRLEQWQMHPDQVCEISRIDLERIARGTPPQSKPRTS